MPTTCSLLSRSDILLLLGSAAMDSDYLVTDPVFVFTVALESSKPESRTKMAPI